MSPFAYGRAVFGVAHLAAGMALFDAVGDTPEPTS
jgi:hypothetical protein